MTWPGLWMVGGLQTGSLFERWFRWSGGVFVCCALEVKKPREHDYDFFFWPTTAVHLRGSLERWTPRSKYPSLITSHHTKPVSHTTIHYHPTQHSRHKSRLKPQKLETKDK